jgi:hypothetical protein
LNAVRKDFTPSERVAIERTINAEIDPQIGGRRKVSQEIGRVSDRSAELTGFGNRVTEKRKARCNTGPSPFPRQSVLREKSLTSAKGERGETEASHISRGRSPSGCGKKVTPQGGGT